MNNKKKKIGIGALAITSFIIGGFALNAYQADAFTGNHILGGIKCELNGVEKGTEEWKNKVEECKAEREAKIEEWKNMTEEEREAKREEMKEQGPKNDGEKRPPRKGFGPMGMFGASEKVNREVVNIDNGVQITITSDNSEIVQKIQDVMSRMDEGYNQ